MPNWTFNYIEMQGIDKEDLYDTDGSFDFNKLIPMPKSLDISSGSTNDYDIVYYLTDRCTQTDLCMLEVEKAQLLLKLVTNSFSGSNWVDEVIKRLMEYELAQWNTKELQDKHYSDGQTLVNNYLQYGCITWYDWCTKYWGTKWNACETYTEDNVVSFNTAWSEPYPIFEVLSKKFPDREIHIESTYEGGEGIHDSTWLNGEIIKEEWREEEPYDEDLEEEPE